jgi:phosphoribosylanthranilate isomerase
MSVLVKICGLTNATDVDAAVASGADLVGFVLVPASPRAVTPEHALELTRRVPAGVRTVAVCDDAATAPVTVPGTVSRPGFDLVQIYDTSTLRRDAIVATRGAPPETLADGVPVLLDLAFGSRPDVEELRAHWRRAATVRAPVVLAGSLDAQNVAEAVRIAQPWAVDAARGVESSPGRKDHELIRRFVTAAKEAAR